MTKRAESMAGKPLTAREVAYLRLVAEGLPNKAIAERIGTSDKTTKNMVSFILAKLSARSRTHAVVLALRAGIIELPDVETKAA